MNINIVPVSINKTPALAVVATAVVVSLIQYDLGGHSATVLYQLLAADGTVIVDGRLALGAAVVDAWGTDDSVLVNAVLAQLGVVKAV